MVHTKPYLIAKGPCKAWSAWQLQAGDVLQHELEAKPPEKQTKNKKILLHIQSTTCAPSLNTVGTL